MTQPLSYDEFVAPSLFPQVPVQAPKPARPPGETGCVAVLRDWYEEQGHLDMLDASVAALYVDPRSKSAPDGLRALVFEHMLAAFDADALAKRLHKAAPRARARRLTVKDIAAAIESHRLGLRLADRWNLSFYRVVTQAAARGTGVMDVVTLRSLETSQVGRHALSGLRPNDTRIDLTGSMWRPEKLPRGWAWSGHKRWIAHPFDLPREAT